MKKISSYLITVFVIFSFLSSLEAQTPIGLDFDPLLLNWLKSNVSPDTGLPYSFYVASNAKSEVYQHMDSSGLVTGAIERMITKEGLDIYDGAVYQIVLSMAGGKDNLKRAFVPLHYYWQGSVGNLANIRAGWPVNQFIYDTKNPQAISSDQERFGQRGFIFRIIDANGNYLVSDPKDGKQSLVGFPEFDRLHWVDWKPVAGENAWVVMAAMQLYYKKYCQEDTDMCRQHPQSVELRLSEELARAAMMLQSKIGGIRMSPLGAYRDLEKGEERHFTTSNWWYNHISTENNISWYGALRMLYKITGKSEYRQAMQAIERYMHFVWNAKTGYFYQGAYEINGQWFVASQNFATDVQTWSLDCFGPKIIDAWFGPGAAWRIWQTAKAHAGVFNERQEILGVGYTDEHDRISVEWSAGAMVAMQGLAEYYSLLHANWSQQALQDKLSMRRSMENLRFKVSMAKAAYSYSSRRGWIPFGWNSHDPQVMSMASTGWMMFVDAGVDPFWFMNSKEPIPKAAAARLPASSSRGTELSRAVKGLFLPLNSPNF